MQNQLISYRVKDVTLYIIKWITINSVDFFNTSLDVWSCAVLVYKMDTIKLLHFPLPPEAVNIIFSSFSFHEVPFSFFYFFHCINLILVNNFLFARVFIYDGYILNLDENTCIQLFQMNIHEQSLGKPK